MNKRSSARLCAALLALALPASAQDEVDELSKLMAQEVAVVASMQAEPLHESPVIITVITGEDIKKMGARTINDVLLTIPGFTRIQDHNEYYSALRGIYGSSQQKILVLRDGHRLNSRVYSEANFGPAIGLNNVKRIEVMRGPGATLYGDVATAGVINIITKTGAEFNGQEVVVGGGSHGQLKTAYQYGKDLGNGRDLSVWGEVYKAKGEERSVQARRDGGTPPQDGTTTLDRFGHLKPAHDVGANYKSGDWKFMVSHRLEHYTMPRAGGGGTGQLIDQTDYRKFEGVPPGAESEFFHSELAWSPKVGIVNLVIRPYLDTFTFRDNEPQRREGESGSSAGYAKGYTMKWHEVSYGGQVTAAVPYESPIGRGDALVGAQAETMDLQYSWDIHQPDAVNATSFYVGNPPVLAGPEVLPPGKEHSFAGFGQVKHKFSDKLILNTGARYDYRKRIRGYYVDELAPRAAFIFTPLDRVSFRASYGRSFSDAPYWYRYNAGGGGGYTGSANLEPETMDSWQLSAEIGRPAGLSNRINLFYNDFKNVIYRDATGAYQNSGVVKYRGAEYELGWKRPDLTARLSYTLQLARNSSVGYTVRNEYLEDVPQHFGAAVVDWAPLQGHSNAVAKGLWLHLTERYVGRQYAPIVTPAASGSRDLSHTLAAYWLTNVGVSFENFYKSLTARFHVYNALDKDYLQGGSVSIPYEQPGRWWMATLAYKW